MIWQQVAAGVCTAVALGLLSLIYREVRQIAELPRRLDLLEFQKEQAHDDLWAAVRKGERALVDHQRAGHT